MSSSGLSDLELLLLEIDVLWGIDAHGRYSEPPLATLAVTPGGLEVSCGPRVRNQLADALERAGSLDREPLVPQQQPAALDACRRLLAAEGFRVTVTGGPSYAVESVDAPAAGDGLLRSTDPKRERARGLRPDQWTYGEWDRLIDGTLGEWAMVIDDGQVVSICHTPRDTRWGAEAGTWTDPDHQARGHASAATAVWAELMGNGRERPLFYSTSGSNRSSQRVAERLGLRPLGWLWNLTGRLAG